MSPTVGVRRRMGRRRRRPLRRPRSGCSWGGGEEGRQCRHRRRRHHRRRRRAARTRMERRGRRVTRRVPRVMAGVSGGRSTLGRRPAGGRTRRGAVRMAPTTWTLGRGRTGPRLRPPRRGMCPGWSPRRPRPLRPPRLMRGRRGRMPTRRRGSATAGTVVVTAAAVGRRAGTPSGGRGRTARRRRPLPLRPLRLVVSGRAAGDHRPSRGYLSSGTRLPSDRLAGV